MADWTKVSNIKGPKGDVGPIGPMPVITWPNLKPVTPLFAPRLVAFKYPYQSGIYTVPSDVRAIYVEVIGGGGAGGNSFATITGESSVGGGGGGGGYAAAGFPHSEPAHPGHPDWNQDLLPQYEFFIAPGGVPGIGSYVAPTYWRAVGATTDLLVAHGGTTGGYNMASGSTPAIANGGLGGPASGVPYGEYEQGTWGGHGLRLGGEICMGGAGGISRFSLNESANKPRVDSTMFDSSLVGNGFPASGPGGGGAGAISYGGGAIGTVGQQGYRPSFAVAGTGGPGYQGMVKIWEYL